MIITDTEIVCPCGTPGADPVVIDLTAIFKSEARQDEVAIVNKVKAQELVAEFIRSWRSLDKLLGQVRGEKLNAERALQKREAVLMVEVVPEQMKSKGLASNDANRKALVILDDKFQGLQDTFDQIEAVYLYLQGKMHSFEKAYSSANKVLGDSSYMSNIRNSNLSGGASDTAMCKPIQASTPPSVRGSEITIPKGPAATKGWGKPRY